MAALGACLRHRPSRRVGLVAVLPIFELTLADDVVDDVTFSSEPVPSADTDFQVGVDHSSRAARLFGDHVEIASSLSLTRSSRICGTTQRLPDGPPRVGVSEARAEARRRLSNLRIGPEQLEARAAELGFLPRGASGDDDDPG